MQALCPTLGKRQVAIALLRLGIASVIHHVAIKIVMAAKRYAGVDKASISGRRTQPAKRGPSQNRLDSLSNLALDVHRPSYRLYRHPMSRIEWTGS